MNTETSQLALTPATLEATIQQIVAQAAERIYEAQGKQGGLPVSKAWVNQRKEEIERLGTAKAPWWCFWYEPGGKPKSKSCGPGKAGERLARQLAQKVQAQLTLGTYGQEPEKTWEEFRQEYELKILTAHAPETQRCELEALDRFERLVGPTKMGLIKTVTIDDFTAKRRREQRKYRRREASGLVEDTVSESTVNKDLRLLRAILKKAWKWKYLPEMPDFVMLREPRRLPDIMEPEHFAALYLACECMDKPAGMAYQPADWWRGLLVTLYMVGWRVMAVLALKRCDVDFERGMALTHAEDTKGKRDQRVPIHPVVLEHWARLSGFTAELFPWPHHRRTLWADFHRLCAKAVVPRYGFHSMKRAFCTLNAPHLSEAVLGFLAQHQHPSTTKKWYIDPSRAAGEQVAMIYVPDVLKKTGTEG